MPRSKTPVYLCETLPNVGSYVASFDTSRRSPTEQTVKITPDSVEYVTEEGDLQQLFKFPCIADPKAWRLQSKPTKDSSVMSLAGSAVNKSDLGIRDCTKSEKWTTDPAQVKLMCRRCLHPISKTSNCGVPTFTRILPMPSANWREMSEFWYCHKENLNGRMPKDLVIETRKQMLLYSDTTFQVHPDDLSDSGMSLVQIEHTSERTLADSTAIRLQQYGLRCSRCRSMLGKTSIGHPHNKETDTTASKTAKLPHTCAGVHTPGKDVDAVTNAYRDMSVASSEIQNESTVTSVATDTNVKTNTGDKDSSVYSTKDEWSQIGETTLFRDRVAYQTKNNDTGLNYTNMESIHTLARKLLQVVETEATYHISVVDDSNREGEPRILIWHLNMQTQISTNANVSTCLRALFEVHGEISKSTTTDTPTFNPRLTPDKTSLDTNTCTNMNNEFACVHKFLYIDCGDTLAEDEDSERRAFMDQVLSTPHHRLELPQSECLELIAHLRSSTLSLPPTRRHMQGYRVGLMPCRMCSKP
eukprot:CFRG8455T1